MTIYLLTFIYKFGFVGRDRINYQWSGKASGNWKNGWKKINYWKKKNLMEKNTKLKKNIYFENHKLRWYQTAGYYQHNMTNNSKSSPKSFKLHIANSFHPPNKELFLKNYSIFYSESENNMLQSSNNPQSFLLEASPSCHLCATSKCNLFIQRKIFYPNEFD